VDSCYFCVVGGKVIGKAPAAREGFGTCYQCSAHACALHGIRLGGKFVCADCLATIGTATAISYPPPVATAGPDVVERIVLSNPSPGRLPALAPGVRDLAGGVFETGNPEQMTLALEALLLAIRNREFIEGNPTADPIALLRARNDDIRVSAALGIADRSADWGFDQLLATLEVARERAALTLLRLSLREPFDAGRFADLALWSVASAYSPREGGTTLDRNPLHLFGGALLPPLVLFLATAYGAVPQ